MQRLAQTVLLVCILLLVVWVRIPSAALAGLGLAAVALGARRPTPAWVDGACLAALWFGSLMTWTSMAGGNFDWNLYYVIPAALMTGAIWLTAQRVRDGVWRNRWNGAVMGWLLCAAFLSLGAGYFANEKSVFYSGLLATLIALVVCRMWFRWHAVGAQAINTVILLLVGLPIVDLAYRPQARFAVTPENCRLYYSYNAARGDPGAFARWQEYYSSQFDQLGTEVFTNAAHTPLPFRLRPGSHGTMIRSPISINSLGFRGREFSLDKKGAYRIVAMGESTTFGMTIQPEDKPWPEVLEQIIRQRLKTGRPVQVINAGVPAYTLESTLYRLPREILALRPDMIIAYHGANGFSLIDSSVLAPVGPAPPIYRERPLKLAAEAEHRLRMLLFRHHTLSHRARAPSSSTHPLETRYAADYRKLIQCARANGIHLALANFSMAVNPASDARIIDFYDVGLGGRAPRGFMLANGVHSEIILELTRQNPDVCYIDTHPHLDGDHEKFIDLIHFTGEGDRQLAENIFTAIRPTIERDLAPR
jgi:lysophospholipase L1-like esterase